MPNTKNPNPESSAQEFTTHFTGEFTAAEIKLFERINLHRPGALANSLQFVHDLALYHSDISINTDEKNMLYDVIELSRALGEMEKG